MRAVEKRLPQYNYLYFGDTKHLPYGDRTEKEIYDLTKTGIEILFSRGATLIIIACNTASAETLRKLQDTFLFREHPDKRILGVIIPTTEAIIEAHVRNVLLVGTRRTIDSHKYHVELEKKTIRGIRLTDQATPELVPLIEAGDLNAAMIYLRPFLERHKDSGGDAVILGCTHYCALREQICAEFETLTIFSQDKIIPQKLENYLRVHPEIEATLEIQKGDLIQEELLTTT